MTVTISKMSAGKGYDYFLRNVAAGDGDRSLSTPLTCYYTEDGTPPGRWRGSGVASLESHIKIGDEVTEEQLRLLIGEARHPVTGQDFGPRPATPSQRPGHSIPSRGFVEGSMARYAGRNSSASDRSLRKTADSGGSSTRVVTEPAGGLSTMVSDWREK